MTPWLIWLITLYYVNLHRGCTHLFIFLNLCSVNSYVATITTKHIAMYTCKKTLISEIKILFKCYLASYVGKLFWSHLIDNFHISLLLILHFSCDYINIVISTWRLFTCISAVKIQYDHMAYKWIDALCSNVVIFL